MVEQMKPSGIDWIGDIPQSWKLKRIKYLSTLKGRIGWQGLTADEYVDEGPFLITGTDFIDGTINWDTCVHITQERWAEAPEIHIKNGDLLITKDGTVGKVAIVSNLEGKASLNSGVLLIRTFEGFDKRFLYWVLLSDEFWVWFKLKNAGNSTIIHLYQNDFAEFCYTFPNVIEQKAIADFLDKKCGKIDGIISDLEKQIETLQKYKKSLILKTVTKGLNKNAPMKSSGIDWIGDIPSHWEVSKAKYSTTFINGYAFDSADLQPSGKCPVVRIGDIKECGIDIENGLFVNENFGLQQYAIKKGDILLAMSGATVGKVGYVDIDDEAYINQRVGIIRLKNSKFLFYVLQTDSFMEHIFLSALGSAQPNVSSVDFGKFTIPCPNDKEKNDIINYLDDKCGKIDSILKDKQEQLEKIKQHKKSLIYEYVTGKKRVKEAINGN